MAATRDRLTDALVRVVAERGLDAVSVREVAAAADLTGGTVQHHFPTKQSMLIAALERVTATFQARAEAALAGQSPAAAVGRLARELLPLDAERDAEGRVWLAFVARAAVDPGLAAIHRTSWQELEEVLATLIDAASDAGDDSAARAAVLLATLDGLAVGGLVEPDRLPPNRIEQLLDRAVTTALAGRAGSAPRRQGQRGAPGALPAGTDAAPGIGGEDPG